MISRAGANAICELLALRKPNVLIPLSAEASRGDQLLNAESFRKQGFSEVLTEDKMNNDTLVAAVRKVYTDRAAYIDLMSSHMEKDAVSVITDMLRELAEGRSK